MPAENPKESDRDSRYGRADDASDGATDHPQFGDESTRRDSSHLVNRFEAPITVRYVDDDPHYRTLVSTALEGDGRFEVRTETAASTARSCSRSGLDRTDCVVYGGSVDDGLTLLEAIREYEPDLPFVLFSEDGPADGLAFLDAEHEPARAFERTPSISIDYVRKRTRTGARALTEMVSEGVTENGAESDSESEGEIDAGPLTEGAAISLALLERRIVALVQRRRASTALQQALLAIETTRDGVAIVGSEGALEFVDRTFASEFGYAPDELRGRDWDAVYDEATADRLRSTAFPIATDGWQWIGSCVGRRKSGDAVAVRTRIAGLDDGSLVMVVHGETPAN